MARNVTELTDKTFDEEILNADLPSLVDFWAPWQGACRQLSPTIERFAREVDGVVKVGKHNTERHPEIAVRYRVAAIPTLIFFKDGTEVHRETGSGFTVDHLKRLCAEHLGVSFSS